MRLALYEPDIPQNAGAILRLGACLGVAVDLIEPFGFIWTTAVCNAPAWIISPGRADAAPLLGARSARVPRGRLILLTTQGSVPYHRFAFAADDTLLLGRESAGVPAEVHAAADARVTHPDAPRPALAQCRARRCHRTGRGVAPDRAAAAEDAEREQRSSKRRRRRHGSRSCAIASAPRSRRSRTSSMRATARRAKGSASAPAMGARGRRRRHDGDAQRPRLREGRRQRLDRLGRVQPGVPRSRSPAPRTIRASGRAASRSSPICARRWCRRCI